MIKNFNIYLAIPLFITTFKSVAQSNYHIVKEGESLSLILHSYGIKNLYGEKGNLFKFAKLNNISKERIDFILPKTKLVLPLIDVKTVIQEDSEKVKKNISNKKENKIKFSYGAIKINSQNTIDSRLRFSLFKISYYHHFKSKNDWSIGLNFGNVFFRNIGLETINEKSYFKTNDLGVEMDVILNKKIEKFYTGISLRSLRYLVNTGVESGQAKYVDSNIYSIQTHFSYNDESLLGFFPFINYGLMVPFANESIKIKNGYSTTFGLGYDLKNYQINIMKNQSVLKSERNIDKSEGVLITLSKKILNCTTSLDLTETILQNYNTK